MSAASPDAVSVDTRHRHPSRVTTAVNARVGGPLGDRSIPAIPAIDGGQHRIESGVVGELQPRGVEPVTAQPQLMFAGPVSTAVVDEPVAAATHIHVSKARFLGGFKGFIRSELRSILA